MADIEKKHGVVRWNWYGSFKGRYKVGKVLVDVKPKSLRVSRTQGEQEHLPRHVGELTGYRTVLPLNWGYPTKRECMIALVNYLEKSVQVHRKKLAAAEEALKDKAGELATMNLTKARKKTS